jgi:hypothetical protein
MRHNWSLVLVILFMLGAGTAERLSAIYVHKLEDNDKALARQAEEMTARTDGQAAEMKKYQEIERLAGRIQDQIRWEPDSTRVIRSFGDIAVRVGVKLAETRTAPGTTESLLLPGGAYQRMRIELRLMGSYWSLVQYVDAIERGAQPMVIESLTMTADRDKVGTGDLRMTVSVLYPVPTATEPEAMTKDAR